VAKGTTRRKEGKSQPATMREMVVIATEDEADLVMLWTVRHSKTSPVWRSRINQSQRDQHRTQGLYARVNTGDRGWRWVEYSIGGG
jgi:hypothetical protein